MCNARDLALSVATFRLDQASAGADEVTVNVSLITVNR